MNTRIKIEVYCASCGSREYKIISLTSNLVWLMMFDICDECGVSMHPTENTILKIERLKKLNKIEE